MIYISKAVKRKRQIFLGFHIFIPSYLPDIRCVPIVHARNRKNNANLRMKCFPGLKQQGQLRFASPPFLFFFLSPSVPASQKVRTAESAPAWMKMSLRALCLTWILYSSRLEKEVVLPAAWTPSLSCISRGKGSL